MSRRERQRAELRELGRSGRVERAVDLAFTHFAEFGRDDEMLTVLADALERSEAPSMLRRRFAELQEGLVMRKLEDPERWST
jgi:hypothetical protein